MEIRLAELLASLSLVSDLGMGYEPDHAIESCLIASVLAREMNLSPADQHDVYYTTLLCHVGCTAGAYEQALVAGGDDIAFRGLGSRVVFGSQREVVTDFMLQFGTGQPLLNRARTVGRLIMRGEKVGDETSHATCEVASQMARRIGLSEAVQQSLFEMFERWDGKGLPHGHSGDEISMPIRFSQVASQAALFYRIGGRELAINRIRDSAGSAFDPAVAAGFVQHGPGVLREIDRVDVWTAVLEAEPRPRHVASEADLDRIARVFADAVDLKSPWMHQHSVGVAALCEGAARELNLGEADGTAIRRAALLHDLGRVGIPNGIWDKPGALTTSEWEQVRLHPYHSERILSRSTALEEVAGIAGMHHERIDGGGYYRRLPAAAISLPARILAAADSYQAMIQDRPYRPAMSPDQAAGELIAGAESGGLDTEAVRAVLAAAGRCVEAQRVENPGGLTQREIEVLRLASRGMTNREMGEELSISPKTIDHHVQHIYDKIGVSTRAAAALYAMEHNLLQ